MWYLSLTFAGVFMILGIYGGYEVGTIQACNLQGYVPGLEVGGHSVDSGIVIRNLEVS